jgi:hypothetical protein
MRYRIWFTDNTPPTTPSAVHWDDGPQYWDNDGVLEFRWTEGTDPNSGIYNHVFDFDPEVGDPYYQQEPAPTTGTMTICSSGCDFYAPILDREYSFQIFAVNGEFPVPTDEWGALARSSTASAHVWVAVDTVHPVTTVTSPAAGSWHGSDFAISISDTDDNSGLDVCNWSILSSGEFTRPWELRTCNAPQSVTVGPTANCRHEGVDTCVVQAGAWDIARNSYITTPSFSIDWTPDAILQITGWTEPGGSPVPYFSWTNDAELTMEVTSDTTASPHVGMSWTMDAAPDCTVNTPEDNPLTLQLPPLTDGWHSFVVRAIDTAGNCGPTDFFGFGIDTMEEPVISLTAQGPQGELFEGVWHNVADPEMHWDPSSSTAPVYGYSHVLNAEPDCNSDTGGTWAQLQDLTDGITTFQVRAIDEAGNCGPPSTFEHSVDVTPDSIETLFVNEYSSGPAIAPQTWQADNDPFVYWFTPFSASPIAGFTIDVDQEPACTPPFIGVVYQFPPDALSNGVHVIQVRPVDEAGNCGDISTFEIWVNSDAGTSPGDILAGLRVDKNAVDPDDVDLSWTASCSDVAIDYSIHEGTLGSWYTHGRKECSTFGALSMTITPEPGNRYFLVVPVSWSEEGSYGWSSTVGERPVSAPTCMPVQSPTPHCP